MLAEYSQTDKDLILVGWKGLSLYIPAPKWPKSPLSQSTWEIFSFITFHLPWLCHNSAIGEHRGAPPISAMGAKGLNRGEMTRWTTGVQPN